MSTSEGRTNRVVSRLVRIVVILGVLGAGAHFGGKYYVKTRIDAAIGQLQRAGVDVEYDAVDVEGLLLPKRGVVRDVAVYIPAIRWRFTLPEAASALSIDTLDQFAFALPDTMIIEITDAEGAPTGRQLRIDGSDLEAVLTATSEDVYDFALSAERAALRREGGGEGANETLILTEVAAQTRVEVDKGADTAAGVAHFDLAGLTIEAPGPSGSSVAMVELYDVEGDVTLDATRFGVSVGVESMSVNPLAAGVTDGEITLERFSISLDVAAKDALELGPVLETTSMLQVPEALAKVGYVSVLAGGRMDQDFKIGLVRIALPDAGRNASDMPFERLEINEVGYEIDIAPERLGLVASAEGVRVETNESLDIFLNYKDIRIELAGTAGENGFDYNPIFDPSASSSEGAVAEAIRQLQEGGEAIISVRTGQSDMRDPNNMLGGILPESGVPSAPFFVAAGASDAGVLEFHLNNERFRAEYGITKPAYRLEGALTGDFAADAVSFAMEMPITGSEQPQFAPVRFELANMTLDPNIRAQLDPGGALDMTINKILINFEFGFDLPSSLLDDPEAFFTTLQLPHTLRVSPIEIDMAGFTATATGEAAVDGGEGDFTVALAGWRPLLDTLLQAPIVRETDAAATLLTVQGVIVDLGAPGEEPGSRTFEIAIENRDVSINGVQLQDPPIPAPQPVNEESPDPEPILQPEEDAVIEPTPAPQPEEDAVIEPTPAPLPEEDAVIEPTPAPQPEEDAVIEPTPAPQPDEDAVIEPTPAPQPEEDAVIEPTPAPQPEEDAVIEPTPAPQPDEDAVIEPTPAPQPEEDAVIEPTPAPQPEEDAVIEPAPIEQ